MMAVSLRIARSSKKRCRAGALTHLLDLRILRTNPKAEGRKLGLGYLGDTG
jgi:hypothetical protein